MKCKDCPFFWVDSDSIYVCDILYKLHLYYYCGFGVTEYDNGQGEKCPLHNLKEEPNGNKEYKKETEEIAEKLFHILYPKANYDLYSATDNEYWTTIMKANCAVKNALKRLDNDK